MVYLAGSRSLAVLEMMAHCSIAALRMKYAVIEVRFDRRLAKELSEEGLPANWQSDPAPSSTHRIGDEWVRDGRSLALSVPSSIVPQERNFLLNPSHAHFAKMSFGEPRAFQFDSRLLG
jgi:RES domain-containing protein